MRTHVFIFFTGLVAGLFFSGSLVGQSRQADSTAEKSELRLGLRYTSDYVYMGRADTLAAPYLTPSLGYYHKSGFFLRTAFSYLTSEEERRIDLYTLTAGYAYYGRRFAWGLGLTEYFFDESSYAVQAEMETLLSADIGYDFAAFMLFANAGLGLSEETDVFLGAELSRIFYAVDEQLWIEPSLSVNAGSQQYYTTYYTTRSRHTGEGKDGHGHGNSGNGETVQVLSSDAFQLLDYEAALQLSYNWPKVRLFALVNWAFPLNPATIRLDQQTYEEELDTQFYWSSGIRFRFR